MGLALDRCAPGLEVNYMGVNTNITKHIKTVIVKNGKLITKQQWENEMGGFMGGNRNADSLSEEVVERYEEKREAEKK